MLGVEGRHASYGKPIPPMTVRHTHGVTLNSGQARHVRDLLKDSLIHFAENLFRPINSRGDEHSRFFRCRNFPDNL